MNDTTPRASTDSMLTSREIQLLRAMDGDGAAAAGVRLEAGSPDMAGSPDVAGATPLPLDADEAALVHDAAIYAQRLRDALAAPSLPIDVTEAVFDTLAELDHVLPPMRVPAIELADEVMGRLDLLDSPLLERGAPAPEVDLADSIFAALDLELAFEPVAGALREAVAVSELTASELAVSERVLDELARDAEAEPLSAAIRARVSTPVDVADEVLDTLGSEQDFALIAAALREVVAEPVDVADAVLDAVLEAASWDMSRRDGLAAALHAVSVDVTAGVFEALEQDEAFVAVAAELRASVCTEMDLAGPVMADLTLDERSFSAELQAAVSAPTEMVDVADGVMSDLALDAQFFRTAAAVRAAVSGRVALADQVFAALAPIATSDQASDPLERAAPERRREAFRVVQGGSEPAPRAPAATRTSAAPRRASWWAMGAGAAGFVAMAAALLLWIVPGTTVTPPGVASLDTSVFELSARNEAQVEDLSSDGALAVQVMQFEEGGVTFIFVDEGEPNQGVPL